VALAAIIISGVSGVLSLTAVVIATRKR